jgi:hypothetical protein
MCDQAHRPESNAIVNFTLRGHERGFLMQAFPMRLSLIRVAAIALIGASTLGCSKFKSDTPSLTAPAIQTTQSLTPPQSLSNVPKPAPAETAAQPEQPALRRKATGVKTPPAPTPKLAQPTPAKPSESSAKHSALAAPTTAVAPVASAAPSAPALDLKSMEQRLRDTRAIGMMTKLSLKNQVDDLLDEFRDFYAGKVKTPLSMLRQRYDLLLMKVLAVLQDGDAALASAISSSREFIWEILRDPKKFADTVA